MRPRRQGDRPAHAPAQAALDGQAQCGDVLRRRAGARNADRARGSRPRRRAAAAARRRHVAHPQPLAPLLARLRRRPRHARPARAEARHRAAQRPLAGPADQRELRRAPRSAPAAGRPRRAARQRRAGARRRRAPGDAVDRHRPARLRKDRGIRDCATGPVPRRRGSVAAAMSTAFVTGASGFIGGALTKRLVAEGWRVNALARSEKSAKAVRELGANAVKGDLDDVAAMKDGAQGCDVAFHCAAHLGEWGNPSDFERVNVTGTANAVQAAKGAGVARFVHVGTEAALMHGEPLVDVDETAPLQPDSKAPYSRTKARAEQVARAGGAVVIRPRPVWGPGDKTILPTLADAVRRKRFAWVDGGRHRTSTAHIDNVVEGLLLGAQKGEPGEAYFV